MFRPFTNLIITLCFLVIGGCGDSDSELSANGRDENDPAEPSPGGMGADSVCNVAADCVLTASTCCECPSFAAPGSDGFVDSCEDVDCEASEICPAIVARCEQNQCAVSCAPLTTERICEFGFVQDTAGCLVDECMPSPTSGVCQLDLDCVQIPNDCCGCSRGGSDQAILASQATGFQDSLDCSGDEVCPEIDVCAQNDAPSCVAGTCFLRTAPSLDTPPGTNSQFCGTEALGDCPLGLVCLLNQDQSEATPLGVGICVVTSD